MRQEQSIQAAFVKLSNQTKLEHKIRLKASIEVARLLLNQGLTFRGHREDESSLNKGNFLEILSWYAKRCDKIDELVLKKAPKNYQMTPHKIQKDIVTACKLETIKAIMEDLNCDYFSLLVDESCDISRKEQMAIVLRYVDRKGSVVERFIGIIYVHDTSALCLKEAIVNYLVQHSLSLCFIREQCYDGASNMQGRLSGLKVLLTNFMGGSFKRMDELRESQAKKVQVALDMGEVESGKGLNQELGLARAANTRWGSHYKSFKNFISMFGSITDVLDTIVVDSESIEEKAKATGYLKVCQTFEIAFILHLMRDILAITNELNESLQKKEQDITNVILLVKVVKKRLQDLRNEGWDSLIENVSAFCVKNQLETYIVDVCDVDKRFSNLKGLGDLSEMLVKVKKHLNYPFVFRLIKFALLLPVATATVERAFSAMKLIKSE
ncbi:hypothetical protein KY284_036766 [Solanum tuberosum]|nr:hypothetical protein KY284_036766 [Solanum tuberosum]